MMRLQHIVRSVLCCLLCLTVCAVPALAVKLDTIGGVVISQQNTFAITYQTYSGTNSTVYPFNSAPASFEFADGMYIYRWESNLPYDYAFDRVSKGGKVFEVQINVADRTGNPVDVSFDSFSALPLATSDVNSAWKMNGKCEFLVDNQVAWSTTVSNDYMPAAPAWSGPVEGYFSIRYTFTSDCSDGTLYAGFEPSLVIGIPNLMVENQVTVLDEILLSVKNIEGDISSIKSSVTNIEQGVVNLNSTVTDMSTQLQDSNSGIWQSFKESVSSVFVPSAGDLEVVKNGFDQLAQDKLGGAYQAFEYADLVVDVTNNKLKNPGSSPGVEFPGISVPLGGDVGTVTLAASQTVTIPEKITGVLYPVSGVIIPIICVIWTFRQCADMVECFMSGMSYAEFLHRNSDREDDEV